MKNTSTLDDRNNKNPKNLFGLLPLLLTTSISLLIVTVSGIGFFAYLKAYDAMESQLQQQYRASSQAAAERLTGLVSDVPRTLHEYEILAQTGLLPINDQNALGMWFVERLRQNSNFAWVGFGDARTGRYIGAKRGTDIRVYSARPDIGAGKPVETQVDAAGSRRSVQSDENMPYRVTEKAWFKQGMAAQRFTWLAPYEFTNGRKGVTAVIPLVLSGSTKPIGVLHVDLFLDTVDEFLEQIKISKNGRVHLLNRRGVGFAAPNQWRKGDPALASALTQLPDWEKGLETTDIEVLEYPHDGDHWRIAFARLEAPDSPDWILAMVAPNRDFTGLAQHNARLTLGFGLVSILLTTLFLFFFARRITEPLRRVCDDLDKIALFVFEDRSLPKSLVREVAVIGQTVTNMKASLRSFGRYVPTELVRGFLTSGRVAELGGEQRRLTIQFSDIKGFSSIAEKLQPEALVAEMSDYFVTVSEVLRTHRGTIGQIYGDGILAFYNAPDTLDGHEVNACLAALETQQRLLQDRALRRASRRPEFSVRIGLEVGDVIVGNIGTPERFAYNVIGDSVNLASRLENLCKYYGTSIIGTDELKRSTGTAFEWRHLDRVAVVGRLTSLDIYELLARAGELPEAAAAQRNAYEAALSDYFAGCFAEAETKFKALATTQHNDIAATLLAQRCEALQRHPPDAEWNGIYVHTSK